MEKQTNKQTNNEQARGQVSFLILIKFTSGNLMEINMS